MIRFVFKVALISCVSTALIAQQTPTPPPSAQDTQSSRSESVTTSAPEKPRVFITDSQSWEVRGSAGGSGGTFAAQSHGGARPQTAEIIKTFGQRCPDVMVNNRQDLADYVVVLDHEGGKGYLQHRNKVAVFEYASGDVVISHSTLSLGGSVEEACKGIATHWAAHSKEILAAKQKPAVPAVMPTSLQNSVTTPPPPTSQTASVTIESDPPAADIEVDGNFVGNTPSTVSVSAGTHDIAVKKKGFDTWNRKMNVTGGTIHVNAELEQPSGAAQ